MAVNACYNRAAVQNSQQTENFSKLFAYHLAKRKKKISLILDFLQWKNMF